MAIDMKEEISEAVFKLLFEKKVKRLTVKDIVDECNITRQAFLYFTEPRKCKVFLHFRGSDYV